MIGRRRAIVAGALVVLVVEPALYYVMIINGTNGGSMGLTLVLAAIFQIFLIAPWGIVTTYICERFPTHVRASGYGIGYSVAMACVQ